MSFIVFLYCLLPLNFVLCCLLLFSSTQCVVFYYLGLCASPDEMELVTQLESDSWSVIVPLSTLGPGYEATRKNIFYVSPSCREATITHIRVNMGPDGGEDVDDSDDDTEIDSFSYMTMMVYAYLGITRLRTHVEYVVFYCLLPLNMLSFIVCFHSICCLLLFVSTQYVVFYCLLPLNMLSFIDCFHSICCLLLFASTQYCYTS